MHVGALIRIMMKEKGCSPGFHIILTDGRLDFDPRVGEDTNVIVLPSPSALQTQPGHSPQDIPGNVPPSTSVGQPVNFVDVFHNCTRITYNVYGRGW